MTPAWTPVVVSLLVAILGVGGNAVLVAFFLGKLRATQEGFEKLFRAYQDVTTHALGELAQRMRQVDASGDASAVDRARLNVRLDQLELAAGESRNLRDELMKLSARGDLQHRQLAEAVARLRRTQSQTQRQIASLATGRAGVVFTSEPFGSPTGDKS